jgi:hypothetical protein
MHDLQKYALDGLDSDTLTLSRLLFFVLGKRNFAVFKNCYVVWNAFC